MNKKISANLIFASLLCIAFVVASPPGQHDTIIFPGITQNWIGDYLSVVKGVQIGEDSSIQKHGQYEYTISIDDVSFVASDHDAGQILIFFQTSVMEGLEIQNDNEKKFSFAGVSGKAVLNISDRSFEIIWDDQMDNQEGFAPVSIVIRRFFNTFLGVPPSVISQEFVIGHVWQIRRSNETFRIEEIRGDGSVVCGLYYSASIDLDDDLDPFGEVVFSNLGVIESIQSKWVSPRIELMVNLNRVNN